MTKIPFTLDAWLKDKSQKVETRNGRPVHYIGLDRAGWQVFEIFRTNGTSEYRTYHDSYMYCGPKESTYDLFIVTPDDELTELEKACMKLYNKGRDDGLSGDKLSNESLKESAAELLELARKELLSGKMLIEQTYNPDINKAHELGRKEGIMLGKAEALKDLPRWKTIKKEDNAIVGIPYVGINMIGEKMLYIRKKAISISSLMKLPGFKED